jgi:hypothetical protein
MTATGGRPRNRHAATHAQNGKSSSATDGRPLARSNSTIPPFSSERGSNANPSCCLSNSAAPQPATRHSGFSLGQAPKWQRRPRYAHPHGQVHVLALVPETGSGAAIPPVSGRLSPGRLCHGAKEDDSLDEGEPAEGRGHVVGRPAEGFAMSQPEAILVLELHAGRIGIEPRGVVLERLEAVLESEVRLLRALGWPGFRGRDAVALAVQLSHPLAHGQLPALGGARDVLGELPRVEAQLPSHPNFLGRKPALPLGRRPVLFPKASHFRPPRPRSALPERETA